jgi:molecular chaperone Hsp33
MNDLIQTGIIEPWKIGFGFAITTKAVNEIVLARNADPVAAHVLGRAVTAGLLAATGSGAKPGERLNIRWAYQGSLRTLIVDAGADSSVRALISPDSFPEETSKDHLLGDHCELTVVRNTDGKVLNSGTTQSILQNVSDDLAFYLSTSDQIETGISTLIAFNADPEEPIKLCQGIIIQALPDADLQVLDQVRSRLIDPEVRDLLSHSPTSSHPARDVLDKLFNGVGEISKLEITEGPAPVFRCTCSREKMSAVLTTLPIPDRMDIVQKKEPLNITCEFCHQQYRLSIEDCVNIWNGKPF